MTAGIDPELVKNDIVAILGDYDVTRATKEIALRTDDQNMFLLKKFLMSKRVKGLTSRTLVAYRNYLKAMLLEVKKPATEITVDDLRLYFAIKETRDKNTKTNINNIQRICSTFFAFLMQEGYIRTNPAMKIGQIKVPKKKKKAFSDIEIEKLREKCRTNRERAVIETLLCTGCRVTELVNIRIDEIEGDAVIVHGKGQKDRTVYFNAKAQVAVMRYLDERSDKNPYLFPRAIDLTINTRRSTKPTWYTTPEFVDKTRHCDIATIQGMVRNLGKNAGVPNVHPHRFRRTCATTALNRGMDLIYVSKMLGHESVETTQIYLDITEERLAFEHRKYMG